MRSPIVIVALLAISVSAQQCGRRNGYSDLISALQGEKADNYIVGGLETRPNEFPWQISFQVFYAPSSFQPKEWLHNCGGSIINEQWILTAAHCHVFRDFEDYRIVAGGHNLKRQESTAQTFSVDRVIVHPGWNQNTVQDDIALVKIAGRFNLNGRTAAPVCLPTAADMDKFDRATCVTTGWGRTYQNGPSSDVLLRVNLPIVPNPICAIRYRNVRGARITNAKICAGRMDHDGFGVCNGDSGGPLTCLDNGRYKLAGVTSFGVICGSSEHPGVFTRVSAYRSWIDYVIANN